MGKYSKEQYVVDVLAGKKPLTRHRPYEEGSNRDAIRLDGLTMRDLCDCIVRATVISSTASDNMKNVARSGDGCDGLALIDVRASRPHMGTLIANVLHEVEMLLDDSVGECDK